MHNESLPQAVSRRQRLLALESLAGKRSVQWQTCESRLVLSAQLLGELVDPLQLQMHGLLTQPLVGSELVHEPLSSPTTIEPHASAQANQLTGWTAMNQEFGLRGEGQTVAVIDSGIAWDHVALGKGFGSGYRVVGGWDFAENDANPYDDGPTGFHGTHVSGIIGSDNSKSPGVASGVDLVGLRVFNDAGQGQIEWVEQALTWVHNHRNDFENPITTVNLSLGMNWNSGTVPGWATLEDELKRLYDDGIIVTASAGNSFKQFNAPGLSYPAASPYVLPVASVDDNGQLSDFSQRSDRVIAAPGRNILSTVPDHVLGRDGKIDDFSSASGTSMAAPYVAGATVLVREAMEMVGINDISSAKIIDWLHNTADTVYDSVTNANYDRLNLQNAIDTLIPDDNVGDQGSNAASLSLAQKALGGWINHLGDKDVFKFTAASSGELSLDAGSDWVDSLRWQLFSSDNMTTPVAAAGLDAHSLHLVAGKTYELHISAGQEIGPYQLALDFQADSSPPPSPTPALPLGDIDYWSKEVQTGTNYRATASHDGLFTILWQNADHASGSLIAQSASGVAHTDSVWENGALRLDIQAKAGDTFDIQLPGLAKGQSPDIGTLLLANVVQQRGSEIYVSDTQHTDSVTLDLSDSVKLKFGDVQYQFNTADVTRVRIDGAMNSDTLNVVSSPLSDKVDIKPGIFTLENSRLSVSAVNMEIVNFDSGTGAPDRLYMYDSDGDDQLTLRPGNAELTGAGYRFSVQHVDRLFIHATGQGVDLATIYDSAGDDQLTMRPQFTSISGPGYFNSVRGFERVYVYATEGGVDSADLYDSAADDRFATSGESASIVGPGYNSFTRLFERVHAHAEAGGQDVATLYGSSQKTEWVRGSDFVSFREAQWNRNAQGFETTSAFVAGMQQSIPDASQANLSRLSVDSLTVDHQIVSAEPSSHVATNIDSPSNSTASPVDVVERSMHVPVSIDSLRTTAPWLSAQARSYLEPADLDGSNNEELRNPDALLAAADHTARLLEAVMMEDTQASNVVHRSLADLQWHAEPDSERELLDKIFAKFGQ